MQMLPRFVPGYDFIGVIEHLGAGGTFGLSVGQRVAGVLPRMGAHATRISVPPSLLVPVPDELDAAVAATVPLDALTARFSLDSLGTRDAPILIQGAGGSVGGWAAQMARGRVIYGTASARSRHRAEALGVEVLDYRDSDWIRRLRNATNGGVRGAIDHTGSLEVRRAIAPGGRIVRIAFGGESGRRRVAATGFLKANLRRYSDPSERVTSIPMLVAFRREAYRAALSDILAKVAAGSLQPPAANEHPFTAYEVAVAGAVNPEPGVKTVLVMP